jgi:SAM-dependent methyltransferase
MSRQGNDQPPPVDPGAEVQRFYETYPYPPPVDSLDHYRRMWEEPLRRRADHHLFWPAQPFREKFSVLVAGCGTSQAAKYALRWPAAQVTGIDVSATSVTCTEQLKRSYQLENLQVHQLSIERAGELKTTFDLIVCTGVLHHLSDPDAGLRALRTVLEPDGAMHLMVYAPYGRAGIYMMQNFCRQIGIPATDTEIRNLLAALKALPPGHPLEKLFREAPDFHHPSGVADALLHPQDRAYSVRQFFDLIEQGDLTFGRWVRQAPYLPHCGAVASLPQASRITQLPRAEQYAAIELFRGTMVSHGAIVYRSDNTVPQDVRFGGHDWLDFVPVRMSDTLCLRERRPPGAAAVLLYPGHTYTDLVMAVDATELSLFAGIDGNRSVRDIVAERLTSSGSWTPGLEVARHLFERLWWYDQVVFDTSGNQTELQTGAHETARLPDCR